MEELDRGSVCRKTGVSPEAEMDVVTGVELECSYGVGDGRTRSGVVSMPKERSGGPRLDRSCDWETYGYDTSTVHQENPPWNFIALCYFMSLFIFFFVFNQLKAQKQ